MKKTHDRNRSENAAPAKEAAVVWSGVALPPHAPLFPLESAHVGRWMDTPPAPRRWLLKDCLPAGKVGAVIAPGGTGKSQFVIQLAISVATGYPLCGAWSVGETGGVLGLFAEDDDEELHRRFRGATERINQLGAPANFDGLLRGRLNLRSMVGFKNLLTEMKSDTREVQITDYVRRLIVTARQIQDLRLIIIDPAARFRGGVENSAEDTTRFVEALEQVSGETGAAVLVLHHASKAGGSSEDQNQNASRGSSALTDGVRWQMNLARFSKNEAKQFGIAEDDRYRYLSAIVTKSNYAPPQPTIALIRGDGGYLSKETLLPARDAAANCLMFRVLGKVQDEPDSYSVHSFTATFAGKRGELAAGEHAVRDALNRAIESDYLQKGGRGNVLRITETGCAALQIVGARSQGDRRSEESQAGNVRQSNVPNAILRKNNDLGQAVRH